MSTVPDRGCPAGSVTRTVYDHEVFTTGAWLLALSVPCTGPDTTEDAAAPPADLLVDVEVLVDVAALEAGLELALEAGLELALEAGLELDVREPELLPHAAIPTASHRPRAVARRDDLPPSLVLHTMSSRKSGRLPEGASPHEVEASPHVVGRKLPRAEVAAVLDDDVDDRAVDHDRTAPHARHLVQLEAVGDVRALLQAGVVAHEIEKRAPPTVPLRRISRLIGRFFARHLLVG